MGGFGWQRPPLRLLDTELKLDPKIEAQIRALNLEILGGELRRKLLWPDFSMFRHSHLDWLLRQPLPKPRPPLVPAGKGPSTPRPAELGDLGKAIWGVPAVKQAANQLGDAVTHDFRLGWGRASGWEKAGIITTGLLISGGALTGALVHTPSRIELLTFIDGKKIPVPGVDGLSFSLKRRGSGVPGGGATIPLFVPGLGVSGNFNAGEGARWLRGAQYDFMFQFDVAEFIRSRSKK